MVHWSGCTKHLSVGSSGQLTQHVLHWMSELHASGCRRTRKGLPELCVLNGTAVGGLDFELTVRKAAIRHQLTLINGVR